MATKKQIRIVLEFPDRGAFSPLKIGTPHGKFIKTDIEGERKPLHILDGRVFNLPEDTEEFNARCKKVMQGAYDQDVYATPRVLPVLNPVAKKRARKPAATVAKGQQIASPPKAPALIGPPPSGGNE